jgi:type VI protein secretion system component VasF
MVTDLDGPDPRLAEAIRGLRDREPDTDLWPHIASRIGRRQPRVLQIRWPVAAAAALTRLAGGAAVSRLVLPGAAPETTPLAAASSEAQLLLPAGFNRAEATLNDAIDQLEAAYQAAAPTLDPEVRTAIAETLASLDTAIVDARTRAGSSPSDVDAARYLTRTMQRKLSVLRTAANMATRS